MKASAINIGWLFFDRIFRMAAAMLVGIWIARYLGPEQYGLWSYVFLFPTTLMAIANLGFTNTVVPLLVSQHQDEEQNALLGTAFSLRLLAGCFCYVSIAIVSYFVHVQEQSVQLLILVTGINLLFQAFDVIELFFHSRIESKRSVWAKTIAFAVGSGLKVMLLLGHYPLHVFVMTVLVESLLSALLLLYFYSQYANTSILKWRFTRLAASQLLRLSWPLMLGECLIFVYMRVDQFMIHHLTFLWLELQRRRQ